MNFLPKSSRLKQLIFKNIFLIMKSTQRKVSVFTLLHIIEYEVPTQLCRLMHISQQNHEKNTNKHKFMRIKITTHPPT